MSNGRINFFNIWPFGKQDRVSQPSRIEGANASPNPVLGPDKDDGANLRVDRIEGAIQNLERILERDKADGPDLQVDKIDRAHPDLTRVVRDRIDVQRLGLSIYNAVNGHCVGFAIRIKEHGRTVFERQGGYAQMPGDGDKHFTQSTKITIASVGKFFTGMAAVRLLDDEPGIHLGTPIGAYLPSAWYVFEPVKALTFLDLLTHKSRLGFTIQPGKGENDVSFARRAVDKGPDGPRGYNNVNYILIRLLMYEILNRRSARPIPAVAAPVFDGHTIPDWGPSDRALQDASASVFDEYLQATLFRPAGAFAAFGAPVDRAFHYRWPYDGQKGALDDVAPSAGSGGWYMSATGVLRAASAVRRRNILLSPERTRQALDLEIGIDFTDDVYRLDGTVLGKLHGKGGLSLVGPKGGEQAHAAWLLLLPDGIEVVIVANSAFDSIAALKDLRGLVQNAVRPWSAVSGFS